MMGGAEAQLHLYGSSANGFAMKGADLDLCFVISEEGTSKSEIVEQLGAWLTDRTFAPTIRGLSPSPRLGFAVPGVLPRRRVE